MRKLSNLLLLIGILVAVLIVGNNFLASDHVVAAPTKKLPPEAAKLIYCTQTAHAVRDEYVKQLSARGQCMTGAMPAPITAKLCEVVRVFNKPTKKDRRLVDVGITPQFACLTCADDGETKACGQKAGIQFKVGFSAEGSYLGSEGKAAIEVEMLADAKYMDDDTDIAAIGTGAGSGTDGPYNLIKGVISPSMEYNSGTTLSLSAQFSNPAMKAAFALNVTQSCKFKSQPESFVVPVGINVTCPQEGPPEPLPVIKVDPPTQ